MAPHDSDSSDEESEEYTTTDILLGYASKEPTADTISQLGGRPNWLDASQPPSAALARCKICNDYMPLCIQLHGDLPEYFAGHERRLYVWGCRKRTCRRKEGSMRAIRNVRVSASKGNRAQKSTSELQSPTATPVQNLGSSIFGGAPPTASDRQANPFSSSSTGSSNPFSSTPFSNPAPTSAHDPAISSQSLDSTSNLPETFASKVRLSSPPSATAISNPAPEPWPADSSLPTPYPSYHLDADYETLDAPSRALTPNTTLTDLDEPSNSSATTEDADTFESAIDKTFQRFADRLAQNPLQVLRYDFRGFPLLYSKTDAVGRLLAPHQPHTTGSTSNGKVSTEHRVGSVGIGIPPCGRCGATRVFELQLTPQAIAELEVQEEGLEGMEWGSVVVGVCGVDCGGEDGGVGYVEEWVGVQWEERGSLRP